MQRIAWGVAIALLLAGGNSYSSKNQTPKIKDYIKRAKKLPKSSFPAQKLLEEYKANYSHNSFINTNNFMTGQSAILIHGMGMPANQLSEIGDLLFEKGINNFSVTLSCHGKFRKQNCSWTDWYSDLEFAIEIAERLGHEVVLVGFSLGGAVATAATLEFPKRVDRLVSIGPALLPSHTYLTEWACFAEWALKMKIFKEEWFKRYNKNFDPHWVTMVCELYTMIDYWETVADYRYNDFDEYDDLFDLRGVLYTEIKIPSLVLSTYDDFFVDNWEIENYLNNVSFPVQHLYFNKIDKVKHVHLDRLSNKNYEEKTFGKELIGFLNKKSFDAELVSR